MTGVCGFPAKKIEDYARSPQVLPEWLGDVLMDKVDKLKLSLTYGIISMVCITMQGFLIIALFMAYGPDPLVILLSLVIMLGGAGVNDLAVKLLIHRKSDSNIE